MPSPSTTLSGIIMEVSPRAERYIRWNILTSHEGFVPMTAAQKSATPFGLFDTVELVASARGKNLFLKEAHLLKRPNGLAKNLAAFTEAARLARLTTAAFHEIPDYAPIYEIFAKALENYQTPADPAIVTLKAFYKMLQAEGFPAAQDWLAKLPAAQRSRAQIQLSSALTDPPGDSCEAELATLIAWAGRELGVRL